MAVIALDLHDARPAAAEIERLLERLARSFRLRRTIDRDPVHHDHDWIGAGWAVIQKFRRLDD